MRWLFIGVLVILVGLVLSIIWMNDPGDSRLEGGQRPEQQDAPLTPSPQQEPLTPPPSNP